MKNKSNINKKMIRIKFHLGIGIHNAYHEEIFKFEEGTKQKEIDMCLNDWVQNYLDYGSQILKDDEK